MSKQHQNVIVTGSSNGFGYLTVLTMARKGHQVFATMRNVNGSNAAKRDELLRIAENESLDIKVVELDVTDQNSIDIATAQIQKEADHIDVLVNNAGTMFVGISEAYSIEQIEDQMSVNFYGPIRMAKAFLPMLKKNGGLITNVSSVAGRLAFPYFGVYCASKWAMEAYFESLGYELAPYGVDVTIVEPGPFATNLLHSGPKEADSEVIKTYGEDAKVPGTTLEGFDTMFKSGGPDVDPQHVADVISNLVHTEQGQRPIRTVVGQDFGTVELNNAVAPIQRRLITDVLQMNHLLGVSKN
ncbi:SDR family oxidoreductase [Flagellimonas sp.]|uniref:SDR family oxidoreductase n=1 Tax=Flagellimonas sp. TaxID=2058762 RepID=UPI003C7D9B2A